METDPRAALTDPKYAHVSKASTMDDIIREHTFPEILDNFPGTEYSRMEEINSRKRAYFIAGTWNKKFVIFEYAYYKNSRKQWVLFHRWAKFPKPSEFKAEMIFGSPSVSCMFPKLGEMIEIEAAPKITFNAEAFSIEQNSMTEAITINMKQGEFVLFKVGSNG